MPGTDRLLLINAIMGQFRTGFASRIFIVALPTIAAALDADILGISWVLIVSADTWSDTRNVGAGPKWFPSRT
ncbi:MAG: hypothetical protein ACREKS_11545 [Candidatus Rokuibacteriota bacterium]